jgi:hypothetical protein
VLSHRNPVAGLQKHCGHRQPHGDGAGKFGWKAKVAGKKITLFQALAMYVVTVICGLMIHSLLTLPLLYYAITRQSPFEFMTGM